MHNLYVTVYKENRNIIVYVIAYSAYLSEETVICCQTNSKF